VAAVAGNQHVGHRRRQQQAGRDDGWQESQQSRARPPQRQPQSPGNEQREFWGSSAADTPGSRNTIGIKNPIVDELVTLIVNAQTRADLIVRCRALDRVG
jgi:hypothetical protein